MKKTTYLLVKIEHCKPIEDLTDKAAGRIYTIDGVDDVTATVIVEGIVELENANSI